MDVLNDLRSDNKFECKWNDVIEMTDKYQIEQYKIKRRKKFLVNWVVVKHSQIVLS